MRIATTSNQNNTPATVATPPQFFVDHKKGEVNELKQLLKNIMVEKDKNKKRDVIKKVIAYMTLGIDVSKLYSDMVKVSSTNDVAEKKMIYLYLINYAEQNQELAFMAINTFLKDCKDLNPKIRGLALRSLCSLRFSGVTSYLQTAISLALNDTDAYVKKTAIIGVIKLFHLAPETLQDGDYIAQLYKLVKDFDPYIVINAIIALEEILLEKGGIEIKSELIIYLLNRIREFNEFGQSIILDLVCRYIPKDETQMFDIMNILEERFKQSSSSVVLGAIKIFLKYTRDRPHLYKQVHQRLQAPLITMMTSGETGGNYDISYTILSHIDLLVNHGANEVFEGEYKQFFCKYDEPSYIKNLKLDILVKIASDVNLQDILNELSEYVTDVSQDHARRSIKSIGSICLRLPNLSRPIFTQLKHFLHERVDYVVTETVIVLKDVLRKYREFADELVPFLDNCLEMLTEPEGKAAFVWILSEFGDKIEDAPYALEKIIDGYKDYDEIQLTHSLLLATCKLFFKRAPETHKMLGTLFTQINKHCENVDVKEKALFYFKLLKADPYKAAQIIASDQNPIESFYEDENKDISDKIFMELNTLSVIYQQPSEKFIRDIKVAKPKDLPIGNRIETTDVAMEEATTMNLLEMESVSDYGKNEYEKSDLKFDLIGSLDNSLTLEEKPMTALSLNPDADVDQGTFQNLWGRVAETTNVSRVLSLISINPEDIEQKLADHNIFCLASGQAQDVIRFFFFAETADKTGLFLIELQINMATRLMDAKIKSENSSLAASFAKFLELCLS